VGFKGSSHQRKEIQTLLALIYPLPRASQTPEGSEYQGSCSQTSPRPLFPTFLLGLGFF